MNISKYIAFAAVAAVALTGSAAQLLVTYQSGDKAAKVAYDTYADGTKVGSEWYGLYWTGAADGKFAGVKFDGQPVNPDDMICRIEKDNCMLDNNQEPLLGWHYIQYQIPTTEAAYKTTGKYVVVLLDTRDASGNPSSENPTNSAVQAVIAQSSYTPSSASASQVAESKGAWGDSVLDETCGVEIKQPVIKDFRVLDDGNVQIKVENMMTTIKYNVKTGATPTELNEFGKDSPTWSDSKGEATIEVPADTDAKFFRVTRDSVNK